MDRLPEEIFRNNIFIYLSEEDIFNLGQTTPRLRYILLSNVSHPMATCLQYIKTKRRHIMKEATVYDDAENFQFSDLCVRRGCKCSRFRKRKDVVILDPLNCAECNSRRNFNFLEGCLEHNILMPLLLRLSTCKQCEEKGEYCLFCAVELDT